MKLDAERSQRLDDVDRYKIICARSGIIQVLPGART